MSVSFLSGFAETTVQAGPREGAPTVQGGSSSTCWLGHLATTGQTRRTRPCLGRHAPGGGHRLGDGKVASAPMGTPTSRGSVRRFMGSERVGWWVTFAVALFVGTMWALSVPPSGGPDEPAHMVKAAAVAGGDLSTSVQWHDEFPGKVPDTTVKVRTGYNYGSVWDQVTCWSGIRDQPTSCAPGLPPRTGRPMSTETYVGTYQPLYYGLVGLPTSFLPPDRGL